jgi:membrane protein required for colicin V production
MNTIDIVLVLLLVFAFYKGFKNGLLIEVASIIALIAGLYCAFHFSDLAAVFIADKLDWNETNINITAFVITFVAVLIGVNLLGKILTKMIQVLLLGMVNKLLGGAFGLLKSLIILGVLMVFLDERIGISSWISDQTKEESLFFGIFYESGAFVYHQFLENQLLDQIRSWF